MGAERAAPRGRRRGTLLAGITLVLAGATAGVLAPSDSVAAARVVGGNAPVNTPATPGLGLQAHNSPAATANPRDPLNLVVASRVDSPEFSCGLHHSFDGGATWTATALPLPAGQQAACFAPDASFGPDGTLYVSFTSFAPLADHGTVPSGVWVNVSRDGGRSFAGPHQAAGPLAFQVRSLADPSRAGTVYLAWLQAARTGSWGLVGEGSPILVSRSDDGGTTWSEPVPASGPRRARVVAPVLAAGPGDEVLLAYVDVGEDRLDYNGGHEGKGGEPYGGPWALVVARSADRGATWREATVEPQLTPARRFLQLFAPTPSLVADRERDRLFVAFHDARLGDPDVWLWTSDDRGRRWSAGRRVNDSPRPDRRAQLLPALAVAGNGRLDVVYYDRRADRRDVRSHLSFQSSFDGGRSFGPTTQLTDRSFDSRIGYGSERGLPELGSRLGVVATDAGALAVWADSRAGTVETGSQDLARAVVATPGPPDGRAPRRLAGLAAVGAGLAVVGLSLSGAKRRRPLR